MQNKITLVGMNKESRDYRRLVCEVAFSFGKRLEEAVGADAYLAIVEQNAERGNDCCCASHDHCDANEVMDAAMAAHGIAQPDTDDYDMDTQPDMFHDADEAHTELWNAAWSHWKNNSMALLLDPGFRVK